MRKPTCFQLPSTSLHPLCPHPGTRKGLVLSSPPLEAGVYPQPSRAKGMLVAPTPGVLSLSGQPPFLFPPSEWEVPPFFLPMPRSCVSPRPRRAQNHSAFQLSFPPLRRAPRLLSAEVPLPEPAPCPAWLFPALSQNPRHKKGS